jgi:hypothetical protein
LIINYLSASLQEQNQRRTNFSRRNYGLSELCVTLDREGIIQNIGKFRVENGDANEVLNETLNLKYFNHIFLSSLLIFQIQFIWKIQKVKLDGILSIF